MSEQLYRELQQRLDRYSVGFPATKSGVELEILRKLFGEPEAALFLQMSPKLEYPEEIAERVGRPVAGVAALLEDMSRRGLLFRLKKEGSVRFAAIPFVHGLFEFQVARLDRELAELVGRYFEEAFADAMNESAGAFLRTVPVQEAIEVQHNVASFDDACEILKSRDRIVVADCICRKRQVVLDKGCGKPLEACFMFGSMGQYYLDHDMGRQVDVQEAIEILRKAQDAGLVTQPGTAQNPAGMCSCCGDCCGVLASLRRHPRPADLVFSNFRAVLDADSCTGCEECVERCQMDALEANDDGVMALDPARCIGCGLCVPVCPTEALRLEPRPGSEQRTPPKTGAEQMMLLAQKRGVL